MINSEESRSFLDRSIKSESRDDHFIYEKINTEQSVSQKKLEDLKGMYRTIRI